MKKFIIIVCIILIVGLVYLLNFDKDVNLSIENSTFSYYEEVKLSDIIDEDVDFEDLVIETTTIGEFSIEFDYEIGGNIYSKNFKYKVIDDEKPFAVISDNYYIKINEEFILKDELIVADNEDTDVNVIFEGVYDTSVVGEFPIVVLLEDNYGNTNEYNIVVNVIEEVDDYTMDEIDYYEVVDIHKTSKTKIGIDVSAWQGDVNWEEVKYAGIEYVILRIGVGHKDGINLLDTKFLDNLSKVKELDIPVGVYYYSYAKNEEEAIDQAKWIVDTLNGVELELPITFDWEIWNKFNEYELNTIKLNNIARAFMDEVESLGYDSMNYGSANRLRDFYKLSNYKTWLAHYTDETYYEGDYYIWQLTDKGIVPGVEGYCDINVLYE